MKNFFKSFALVLFSILIVIKVSSQNTLNLSKNESVKSNQSTNVLNSRVSNIKTEIWNLEWNDVDSSFLNYTGTRGGDFMFGKEPSFDNITTIEKVVDDWNNKTRTIVSYNDDNTAHTVVLLNWVTDEWMNSQRKLFEYNEQGLITSYTEQNWVSGNWVNVYNELTEYDNNNNETKKDNRFWNAGAWKISYRLVTTYNEDNTIATTTSYTDFPVELTEDSHSTYAYTSGNLTSVITYDWVGGMWSLYFKSNFQYDENNNLTERLNQSYVSGNWVNESKIIINYNTNETKNTQITQYWNSTESEWENNARNLYQYNSNKDMTSEIFQNWNGTEWVNSFSYQYSFDAQFRLIDRSYLNWNGSELVFNERTLYEYNDFNQYTLVEDQYHTTEWVSHSRKKYYYENYDDGTVGIENQLNISNLKNYPNPFKTNTIIEFVIDQPEVLSVSVYDLNGRKVKESAQYFPSGQNQFLIDLSNNNPGIYLLNISGNGLKHNSKLIKL